MSNRDVEEKCEAADSGCGAVHSGTHLAGVVIVQSDGAELGGHAAALGEGGSALPVRAFLKLVCNSHLSHRGTSCPNNHLRQQTGVKHEASKGQDQTHDQKQDQG